MKCKALAIVMFAAGFSGQNVLTWCWKAREARAGELRCAVDNGDTNGDGKRDLSDPIHMLNWLFGGGSEPVPPCASESELESLRNALELCRSDLAEARRRLEECCPTPGEVCGNALDDDGDDLIDCSDPDCAGNPLCAVPGEVCDNLLDDDGDGDIDCADSECDGSDECSGEVCDNLIDDDGDQAIDCNDSDCAASPTCAGLNEVCNNTVDDDLDGDTDCADADCADSAFCIGAALVNEVDYDQPGTDTQEFVEVFNPFGRDFSLAGVALVLVNGNTSSEYLRVDLSPAGVLPSGGYLVVHTAGVAVAPGAISITFPGENTVQNGAPDAVVLFHAPSGTVIDALSYEGAIPAATIAGAAGVHDLVSGAPASAVDVDTASGSLARSPNGSDTGEDGADWRFTTTLTPGAANP